MTGVLYIVATPIGNLSDISERAISTLRSADLVAAEDTRRTKLLLNQLGLQKKLISYHEHNEQERSSSLLERLRQGDVVALVSDAGTPLISDPGYVLVRLARSEGISVVPIPGACSLITALSAAGLPTNRFAYLGFLSTKDKERLQRLTEMQSYPGTTVLLESTHRIERLLEQIAQVFGSRRVVVAKELTKTHERFFDAPADQILEEMRTDDRLKKGEFVVLIDKSSQQGAENQSIDTDQLLKKLLVELPIKKAAAIAADITGKRKNELYQRALDLQADQQA